MGPKRRDWYLPVVLFLLSALIGSAQTPSSSKQKAPANFLAPSRTGLRAANSNFTLHRGLAAYNVALQAGSPVFQAAPLSLDLGVGVAGAVLPSTPGCCALGVVIVKNTGTATLNFSSVTTVGDFVIKQPAHFVPPFPGNPIPAGQSAGYGIFFEPTAAGARTGP